MLNKKKPLYFFCMCIYVCGGVQEVRGQRAKKYLYSSPSYHSLSSVLSQDLSLELELADSAEQII